MKRRILGMDFDTKSLRFKLWALFALFAILIMLLVWFLEIYFLHNNYEAMKIAETTRIAQSLIAKYGQEDFVDSCSKLSTTSDIYIHIEDDDGTVIYSPVLEGDTPPSYMYFRDLRTVEKELARAESYPISVMLEDAATDYNTLAYATQIETTDEN
ncbi:MAG: hypothetical protein IK059_03690, partial [Firmicutes bacterium]|nr:hypothetical protein [Bacillota bacterium]